MLLLRNNKLFRINTSEDLIRDNDFKAIKTLEMLKAENNRHAIRDTVYVMVSDTDSKDRETYNFRRIQSPYSDNSGLNQGLVGSCETRGKAVYEAIRYGYKVYNGDIEITNQITDI